MVARSSGMSRYTGSQLDESHSVSTSMMALPERSS